jgi:hypothetical protein
MTRQLVITSLLHMCVIGVTTKILTQISFAELHPHLKTITLAPIYERSSVSFPAEKRDARTYPQQL